MGWQDDAVAPPAWQQDSVVTPAPAKEGAVAHTAGLTARALLEGVDSLGDIPASLLNLADRVGVAGHNALFGTSLKPEDVASSSPRGMSAARALPQIPAVSDMLGLPQPQTSGEKLYSSAVRGVPGALFAPEAPLIGAASGATGGAASEVAAQAGASPLTQAIVGTAAGILPGAAGAAAKRGLQAALQVNPETATQNIENATAAGAKPTVGLAAGPGTNAQTVESVLTKTPGAAGVMRARLEAANADAGKTIQDIAGNLGAGNATSEVAGSTLQSGLADSWLPTQRSVVKDAYAKRDALVPPTTTVNVDATLASIKKQMAESPTFRQFVQTDPEYRAFFNAVDAASGAQKVTIAGKQYWQYIDKATGQTKFSVTPPPPPTSGIMIPYADASIAQRGFGQHVDFSFMQGNTTARINGNLSQVSQAASNDVKSAIAQIPAAKQAGAIADSLYKTFAEQKEQLKSVMNALTPEDAFNRLMSHAENGATVLNTAMRGLSPADQNLMAGAVIRRMGVATPGAQNAAGDAWSAQRFLTNWNQMPATSRTALFRNLPPEVSENLSKFAAYAENAKKSAAVYANPSGTAPASASLAAAYATASGIGTGAGLMATGHVAHGAAVMAATPVLLAAANLSARAMTNPAVVRWLAASTKVPVSALPVIATQLARVGQQQHDPEITDLAQKLQGNAGAP